MKKMTMMMSFATLRVRHCAKNALRRNVLIKLIVLALTGRRCRSRGDDRWRSTKPSRPRDERSRAQPSCSRQGRSAASDYSPKTAIVSS